MKSEQVAGFVSESMAGFIGIRKPAGELAKTTSNIENGSAMGHVTGRHLELVAFKTQELVKP